MESRLSVLICWVKMIGFVWENKIYLDNDKDFIFAASKWMGEFSLCLNHWAKNPIPSAALSAGYFYLNKFMTYIVNDAFTKTDAEHKKSE